MTTNPNDIPESGDFQAPPPSDSNAASTEGATPSGPTDSHDKQTHPQKYGASICPSVLSPEFAQRILEMEQALGMPVWLLVQGDNPLDGDVATQFCDARFQLEEGRPVALLIDSSGGFADSAYRIARLFQQRCGCFTAIVPRWGKSAATLLALGATGIMLGQQGELGPLDVQLTEFEREETFSALDEVQALESVFRFSLEAIDSTVILLKTRSGKKLGSILPLALDFVSGMMRPLLEKIDTVHYTQVSRLLRVAEHYAVRLLARNYPKDRATGIASHLVQRYPEHGFPIYAEEAKEIGLRIVAPPPNVQATMDAVLPLLRHGGLQAFGRIIPQTT